MRKYCDSCHFYTAGQCRRFPPQLVQTKAEPVPESRFPKVDPFQWCGEFREAKQ